MLVLLRTIIVTHTTNTTELEGLTRVDIARLSYIALGRAGFKAGNLLRLDFDFFYNSFTYLQQANLNTYQSLVLKLATW